MPLSRLDEYLTHQFPEPVDTVSTPDRNFYDRYYFNLHGPGDELFLVAGLGQYPNLGVTDAFVTVAHDDVQTTVRASRELGSDRELEGIAEILSRGNGADRQLRVFNANRDIAEVVEEIAKATEAVPANA